MNEFGITNNSAMSFAEFNELLVYISIHHSPIAFSRVAKDNNWKKVKYLHPDIDFRTNSVFAMTVRGVGYEKQFHTQNECSDLKETLKERVVAFLRTPE